MKKYLMMSAAVVAVLSMSCSKIEDTSVEQEIGFAVASYVPQTKAGELSIRDVDGVNAFKCKAFLHSNGAVAGTNYFGDNGETITYNGSNAWAPASHPYYWPKHPDSYINFVSWYDNNGTPGTVTETSMIWANRTIATNDNIMFADEAWHFKSNAETYKQDNVSVGVPTLFHHALAKVKFQFNASPLTDPNDPNTTFEVKLQSVSLSSVHKQGTLTLTNADPGATRQNAQNAWTPDVPNYFWLAKDAASNIAMVSSNTDLTETPAILYPSAADQRTYSITAQSVLPQQVTDAMVLSITYAITIKYNNNGSTIVILAEQDIPASIQLNTLKNGSNVAITDWLPNKIYTYGITINPLTDQILIDPAIDADWAPENVTATIE